MTHLNDCYCGVFSYVLSLLATSQPDAGCDTVSADILGLLEAADTRAVAEQFAPDHIEDAKFAVCAWVDEMLLRSDWEGAKTWRINQLQQRFFATHNAGVEFFDRLAAMGNTDSPARETYALCLGLGFAGEYFVPGREAEFDDIRRQTLRSAAGAPLPAYGETGNLLFPGAYQPQTSPGKRFNPWAFDWWFFLIPVLTVAIAAELYVLLQNDLNLQLLGFFGSLS